jgi:hypothetical protein
MEYHDILIWLSITCEGSSPFLGPIQAVLMYYWASMSHAHVWTIVQSTFSLITWNLDASRRPWNLSPLSHVGGFFYYIYDASRTGAMVWPHFDPHTWEWISLMDFSSIFKNQTFTHDKITTKRVYFLTSHVWKSLLEVGSDSTCCEHMVSW